jgi:NOL1/NOP2/sun family putative RNA methylase
MKEYPPKQEFLDRMRLILGDDFEDYEKSLKSKPLNSIRVNTLKISPEKLVQRLEKKSWRIIQPIGDFPEIIVVEGKYGGVDDGSASGSGRVLKDLEPGELGRSMEHLLGYYYVQDISSMLPAFSLNPEGGEFVVDLCAAPGSKTSQISAKMENTGTLIANDVSIGRIKILASNLERCGAMNSIITKSSAESLCKKMASLGFSVDKILLDAPCSGEGTMVSSKKTALMWNPKRIGILSRMQKAMISNAFELLREGGKIVYSTCTHGPEENEEVVDFLLKKFENSRLEEVSIPMEIKYHKGLTEWQGKKFSDEVEKCARIYPHDNKTEGFFIAKIRKLV